MNKLILIALALCTLISPLATITAYADESCGNYTCAAREEFDADIGEWLPSTAEEHETRLSWLAEKSVGFVWAPSRGTGVMQVSGSGRPIAEWPVYLDAGTYRMVARAAADGFRGIEWPSLTVRLYGPDGEDLLTGGELFLAYGVAGEFREFESTEFTLTSSGPVNVALQQALGGNNTNVYYDYVWIVRDDTPTPTPAAGTPTTTPAPAGATPIPPGAAYCVAAVPTPTPGPGQFGATPTPTPAPGWNVFDSFDAAPLSSVWRARGSGIAVRNNVGRPGTRVGSVFVPYSPETGLTYASELTRTALILERAFTLPFFVTLYAQADFVPAGGAAYVEAWVLDPAYDAGSGPAPRWLKADQEQISARQWYPTYWVINPPVGGSGEVTAIAFVTRRGNSTSGGAYIDDLYLFSSEALAPRCDGTYPGFGNPGNPGEGGGGDDSYTISLPEGRTCPPPVMDVPNNFWGPLLAGLTEAVDNLGEEFPGYAPGGLVSQTQELIASPLGTAFALTAAFIDIRWGLFFLSIYWSLEIARAIWSAWIAVKKTIPFLN